MSCFGLRSRLAWLPRLVLGLALAAALGLLGLAVYSWLAHGSPATATATKAISAGSNLKKPVPNTTAKDTSKLSKAAPADTPDQTGQWGSLITNWPTISMHAELLPDGNVLTFGDTNQQDSGAFVWDPTTNTYTPIPDTFANPSCGGNNALPDGRIITVGGGGITPLQTANSFVGANTNVTGYQEANQTWGDLASNAFPTWYASTTVLADGNLLRLGGADPGVNNGAPEMPEEYFPATNQWTTLSKNPTPMPMYPFTYVRPDGTVAVTGSTEVEEPLMIYNPTTETWTTSDPNMVDGGSSAMYDTGKVIKAGSSYGINAVGNTDPSAATAYITDLTQATPTWTQTGSMAYPRSFLNLTPLPDGTVLATGGGTTKDASNTSDGVLPAEDWNPSTGQWTTWASMAVSRLYHSIAMLLPDGTVLIAGSGDKPDVQNEENAQIFSPPYLFKGPRPTITSSPPVVQYGSSFQVSTPDAASITSVSLIRTGAVTHSFDESARRVSLSFTASSGALNVQAPATGGDAPPGNYMLFIVNSNGVPSVASWVNLPASYQEDTPPSAPSGLTATATSSSSVNLSWTASTDNIGVTFYDISRNGTKIATLTTTSYTDSGLAGHTAYTYTVTAHNAAGMVSTASTATATTPVEACPCSIWNDGTPTGSFQSNDPNAQTLGVQFQASSSGFVTGVRFYKEPSDTGAHIGSLWSSTGTLLASGTFSNETASGWQELDFSSPVAITAGTTYVASYFTSTGFPAGDPQGLASAVTNAPLTALAGGGVFTYGSANTFPVNTYNNNNYWVDVVYSPTSGGTAPGAPTGVTATAGNASATVNWTAPNNGGSAITSYTVTPYIGSTAQTPVTVSGSPPATSTTVTGLTNGTAYTFTVSATNAVGTGPASSPSNAVTPAPPTVPAAPTGVSATAGNTAATVSWTAPNNGGSAITSYTVTPYIGSAAQTPVTVSGSPPATTATVTGLTNGTAYTFTVSATNAVGTGSASSPSNAVTPAAPSCPCSVWQDGAPTGSVDANDPNAQTLGLQFQASSSGFITGVRFYKETDNTGAHIGSLWSSSGTLLASGTFSNETASGWQELDFSSPVAITAGTTYVASYFTSTGHYAATSAGLVSAVINGPLTALAGGGTYAYGSTNTFPTNTFNNNNYWVDVVYSPTSGATAPGAPTGVSATAGNASATVSWTAPGSGGSAITGYTVTPYAGSTAGTPVTVSGSPPATTATVTGLTNGTAYTFTVSATNAVGTGPASASSAAVTPAVPPSVTSVTPASGATGVSVSVAPSVTFSQAVTPSTVSFSVVDSGGNPVAGTVGFSGGNTVATFTPTNPLAASVTYTATVSGAQNASGTPMSGPFSWSFTTAGPSCPCSVWNDGTPTGSFQSNDPNAQTLGVQFRASSSGFVTGVRFYKESSDTGAHIGSLWSSAGTLLASGTFTGETASGWQELDFSSPVAITAGTMYVASYFSSTGYPASTTQGLASAVTNGPLTALAGGGVYAYGGANTFPANTYNNNNYWVDVVYSPTAGATPPVVTTVTPASGSTGNAVSVAPTATFSQAVTPGTASFTVQDSGGNAVAGAVSFNAADTVATFTPTSSLAGSTTYTATVSGAQNASGTPMSSPDSWSFTTGAVAVCPCSVWQDGTPTGSFQSNDPNAQTLGVQFQASSSGFITGVRFYKEPSDTGAHIGSLWSSSGTLLASGTFTGETASGWQELDFSSPVAITAGTTYVASYFTGTGYPAGDPQGLASAVTNGPLTALAGGGVYAYGSTNTFPTNTYNNNNYWVDVVYSPTSGATAPGAPMGVSATAGNASATVSWTAPSTGGSAITGYTVTPYAGSTAQTPVTVSGSPPATTAVVTGLTNGTAYTFTVSATNAVGTGPASASSAAVTPSVPPSVTSVTPSSGSAGNAVSVAPSVTFSQAVTPSTVSVAVVDSGGNPVAGTVAFSGGNTVATFTPTNPLAASVTYTATVSGAQNGSGTPMSGPFSWSFTTAGPSCPCSIWNNGTPTGASQSNDPNAQTLGVKFTASSDGFIAGVRFYKESSDTGAHIGSLWSSAGTLLASGTFTGETASGWQELDFSSPVAITAGTMYVASYFTSTGYPASTTQGLASAVTNGPLTALAGGGVYAYGGANTFPANTYNNNNYWVDVVYSPTAGATPPSVTGVTPSSGSTGNAVSVAPSATFSQAVTPGTASFTVQDSGGNAVAGAVSFNAADTVATFTPTSSLAGSTTYTATVSGAQNASGTPMSSPDSWSFTTGAVAVCPCSVWQDGTPTGSFQSNDPNAQTSGLQFRVSSSGFVTGVRFYKEPSDTGAHIGSLWSSAGTLLASGTFSNETASGWQELDFSSPVAVTAGTTYVASFFSSTGYPASTPAGLASAVTNGPLTALAGGGTYAYGSTNTFPTNTYNNNNYWVDVVYSPS